MSSAEASGMRSEAELEARARRGSRGDFDRLFEQHYPALVRFLARRAGSALALDLAQESMFRAWRALPRLDQSQAFRPWLLRIAERVAIDEQRKRAIRTPPEAQASPERLATTGNPEDEAIAEERSRALDAALRALPVAQREVFTEVVLRGRSYAELAAMRGVREDTLREQVRAARAVLRGKLAPRDATEYPT